jgi:hypothetical protein
VRRLRLPEKISTRMKHGTQFLLRLELVVLHQVANVAAKRKASSSSSVNKWPMAHRLPSAAAYARQNIAMLTLVLNRRPWAISAPSHRVIDLHCPLHNLCVSVPAPVFTT